MMRIASGSTFLRKGVGMPHGVVLRTHVYSKGWSVMAEKGASSLEDELRSLGWSFFYMAANSASGAFGGTEQSRVDRAVKRILRRRESAYFNGFSVGSIRTRRFLGIPFTTVSGHYRQVQMLTRLEKRGGPHD